MTFTNKEIARHYELTVLRRASKSDKAKKEKVFERILNFQGSIEETYRKTKHLPSGLIKNPRDRNEITALLKNEPTSPITSSRSPPQFLSIETNFRPNLSDNYDGLPKFIEVERGTGNYRGEKLYFKQEN